MIRKVLKYVRGTKLLALGTIIPEDWQYVDIRIILKRTNRIVLELRKVEVGEK